MIMEVMNASDMHSFGVLARSAACRIRLIYIKVVQRRRLYISMNHRGFWAYIGAVRWLLMAFLMDLRCEE